MSKNPVEFLRIPRKIFQNRNGRFVLNPDKNLCEHPKQNRAGNQATNYVAISWIWLRSAGPYASNISRHCADQNVFGTQPKAQIYAAPGSPRAKMRPITTQKNRPLNSWKLSWIHHGVLAQTSVIQCKDCATIFTMGAKTVIGPASLKICWSKRPVWQKALQWIKKRKTLP